MHEGTIAGRAHGQSPAGDRLKSLPAVLQHRASTQPDRLAYVFLPDGESEEIQLTYSQLDDRARRIAVAVSDVAAPGDRAVMLYPPGLDFVSAFFGCLYAGVVAVPLYPPRPNRKLDRLEGVIDDCDAKVALTIERTLADLAASWDHHEQLTGVEYLPTDTLDSSVDDTWRRRRNEPHELAFLQYTSGSTSSPKGVMVNHANLAYNCNYMREAFELSSDTVAVTWLPHFHDMGLIEGLLNPIYTGFPTVVLPPAQFVQKPILWLTAISRFRATHAGAPNFAFDLCVRKIKPQQRDELDLSSWSLAYSGAEPVRRETLERFAEYFAPCGFRREALYPCYGLAEATLMVCGGWRSQPPIYHEIDAAEFEQNRVVPASATGGKLRTQVGCGHQRQQTRIAIVDPVTERELGDGLVGEIWVFGPTNAQGYWQREEDTRATFAARLADTGEGPFMRTGDLGFLENGELFITGRLKDVIILHGANLYPQDIEFAAERAHRGLRPGFGAAFSVDVAGDERLVVAQEVDRQYRKAGPEKLEEIATAVRAAVSAEFEQEVYSVQLLRVGRIPKTSSGKIQRQLCRADFLAGRLDALWESTMPLGYEPVENSAQPAICVDALRTMPPRDRRRALENYLQGEVGRVVGLGASQIDPRKPLGSYGIDSLKGNELVDRLQKELAVSLSNTLVWNHPTIADLVSYLAEKMQILLEADSPSSSPGSQSRIGRGESSGEDHAGDASEAALYELLTNAAERGKAS